ncbi:acyltransferase [Microbacterium soli]|uniref:Acyltransferase 3 domain-containing protein n=1 Tax=Microbacterium soli TaxID=446075 RepID=A0ABP7MVI7_9MICO
MDRVAERASARDGYIPALDGLRAIAVLAVFLLHLAGAYFPGGAVGVDIFFVLSAFLITGLLTAEFEKHGRVRFGAFYLRRAFRLLPALFVWLVIASITAVLAGESTKVPWSVSGALFYFNDFQQAWTDRVAAAFNQSWSLSVEEQFYFVWPPLLVLVLLRTTRRTQRWFLHASVVAAAAIAFAGPNYFLPTGHLLPLVIGCWAAEQHAHGRSRWVEIVARQPWLGASALVVFAFATVFVIRPLNVPMFLLISAAGAAIILNITSGRDSFVTRMLASSTPRWVGERSYGIYLYGLTLMQLVPIIIPGIELKWAAPIDVIVTLVVVALSYHFIEAPIRAWGRNRLHRRPVAEQVG